MRFRRFLQCVVLSCPQAALALPVVAQFELQSHLALIPNPLTQSALAATGFLSSDEAGEAVTALPTVSSAETRIAVAALGEAEGAADASSNPLAANARLLAVCMRGLPDMLTGACSHES